MVTQFLLIEKIVEYFLRVSRKSLSASCFVSPSLEWFDEKNDSLFDSNLLFKIKFSLKKYTHIDTLSN